MICRPVRPASPRDHAHALRDRDRWRKEINSPVLMTRTQHRPPREISFAAELSVVEFQEARKRRGRR